MGIASTLWGCGGSSEAPSEPADAASEADVTTSPDGGSQDTDATPAPPDGGTDARPGSTTEAGLDAAPEATTDAAMDAADDATSDAAPDAMDGATTPPDASDAGTVLIRVAQLSPDLGVALDFCLAPAGTSAAAPYMQSVGVAGGLAYQDVSEYVGVTAGPTYVLHAVAAGASSCAGSLAGIADVTVATGAGTGLTTVALIGSAGDGGAPAPAFQTFGDDAPLPFSQCVSRLIHAAPEDGPIDVAVGGGDVVAALQQGVAFGQTFSVATQATGAPPPDANGYLTLSQGFLQVIVDEAGHTVGSYDEVANRTVFFVGNGTASAPLGFLACKDTGTAGYPGHKTYCQFQADPVAAGALRVVDLAVDGTAIDACVRVQGLGAWVGPLVAKAGVAGGLSFLRASGIVASVPGNTMLDVVWLSAGQACGTWQPVATGTVATDGDDDLTVTLTEQGMGTAQSYATYGYAFTVPAASAPATAQLQVYDVSGLSGPTSGVREDVQIYETPQGSTIETLLGTVPALWGYLPTGATLAAGTYGLRLAAGGATIVTAPGVTVSGGQRAAWSLFADTSGKRHLARCELAAPAAGTLVTCAD
jgi:hypothetical protein